MRYLCLAILFVLLTHRSGAQVATAYYAQVQIADSLFEAGANPCVTARAYDAAWPLLEGKGRTDHRYRAAQAWTACGDTDAAFAQLLRITERTIWLRMEMLRTGIELAPLRTDARWPKLLAAVRHYDSSFNEDFFRESLCDSLIRMAAEDQRVRGASRPQNGSSASAAIQLRDSLHHPVLQAIFRRYGYPDTRLVGARGSSAFWLLVQHQDNWPDFQDSVLRAMTAKLHSGTVSKKEWAYLTDRVLVNRGKKQLYGTQFIIAPGDTVLTPQPMKAPRRVNERRAAIGLGPVEQYWQTARERYLPAQPKKVR